MPTFDYQCRKCNHIQEEFHSISSEPEILCSECGSKCEKNFTMNGNFILKGDNWPSRDYRMKQDMKRKNSKMKGTMKDRKCEAVTSIKDLKKKI